MVENIKYIRKRMNKCINIVTIIKREMKGDDVIYGRIQWTKDFMNGVIRKTYSRINLN